MCCRVKVGRQCGPFYEGEAQDHQCHESQLPAAWRPSKTRADPEAGAMEVTRSTTAEANAGKAKPIVPLDQPGESAPMKSARPARSSARPEIHTADASDRPRQRQVAPNHAASAARCRTAAPQSINPTTHTTVAACCFKTNHPSRLDPCPDRAANRGSRLWRGSRRSVCRGFRSGVRICRARNRCPRGERRAGALRGTALPV